MKPYYSILLSLFLLTACSTVMYDDGIKNAYKYAAESSVRKQLDNPSAAKFGDMNVYKDKDDKITICGTVDPNSSKDGDIWFISDGAKVALSTKVSKSVFSQMWKKDCVTASPNP